MSKRIRIRMRSYDHKILDEAMREIVEVAERTGAEVVGPIPLPTKRRVYTVLRSPHVDKKSREQFEIRIHNRLIDLNKPSQQTIEALTKMDLPARVEVEIKY
ncbi:MAG: 30S ribosomal protein S10 [candidate division WOR-3 bacterium]